METVAHLRAIALSIAGEHNIPSPEENISTTKTVSNEKTRIKRPTVLEISKRAQEKKNGNEYKNKFAELADLFFFPVFKYLTTLLRPNAASKEVKRLIE